MTDDAMIDFLSTTVRDIMVTRVKTVLPGALLGPAVALMRDEDITCLVVDLQDPSRGFGILTQKDVIGLIFDGIVDLGTSTVEEVMSHPCVTLSPEWSLETAVASMRMMGVRRAPVVEAGKLLGLMSFTDVFRHAPNGGDGA